MAAASKEKQLARQIYTLLQSASCPLVEGLFLQEEDSMLQLFCSPSQHRTDILVWICNSINPNFQNSKASSAKPKDPKVLTKEMALLGQELMLCKATDLDLIRGVQSPSRQLLFLKQLLSLVRGSGKAPEPKRDEELLLNELYSPENLPRLTHMLRPALDPWPAHIRYGMTLQKGSKPALKASREEVADLPSLLLSTQTALEQLQTKCKFLKEPSNAGVFSSDALRVAATDLHQMMAAFSHVYETDLKSYCNRAPPSFSPDPAVFKRVYELMAACNTDLEALNELSEVSGAMVGEVHHLQTERRYWSRGEKHTLPDQLEALTRRYREFILLLNP